MGSSLTERVMGRITKYRDKDRGIIDQIKVYDINQFDQHAKSLAKEIANQTIKEIRARPEAIGQNAVADEICNAISEWLISENKGSGATYSRIRTKYSQARSIIEKFDNAYQQENRLHFWEQARLVIARITTAMGIAAGLVFMGLLANKLDIVIGLPWTKML